MACRVGSGGSTVRDLCTEGKEEESCTGENEIGHVGDRKTRCPCLSNAMLGVGGC